MEKPRDGSNPDTKSKEVENSKEEGRSVGTLSSFPLEIKLYILGFFSARELCRICVINKSMKELAQANALWEKLFRRNFGDIRAEDSSAFWKDIFRDEFAYGYKFHPRKFGGFLSLHNDDTTVKIDGTGWASIMVGRVPIQPRGKRGFTFLCETDSEGMMISLANDFDFFAARYPGSGSHGITTIEHKVPKVVANEETICIYYSVTFYKHRKRGEKVSIEIDFSDWSVGFEVEDAVTKNLVGSKIIPDERRRYNEWYVLVSLCSVGEKISIMPRNPHLLSK